MRTTLAVFLTLTLILAGPVVAPAAEATNPGGKPRKIQTEEFDQLRSKTNHVILDVRTAEEFKAGHVKGAVNLNVQDPEFAKKVSSLDRSKTYLVHCARGRRSALATEQLTKAGLTNVLDFSDGFDAWKKAGKPVAQD